MKAVSENFSLVLAGNFNPAILTPQWLAKHALDYEPEKQFQVEMLAPLAGAPEPVRFSFDDFSYSPSDRLLVFYFANLDLEKCNRTTHAAGRALQTLPHTPISGVGFNFRFAVEAPTQNFLSLFTTKDQLVDTFGDGAELVGQRWGNRIKWNESVVNVGCIFEQGKVNIDFNFHYSKDSAASASDLLLSENLFQLHLDAAKNAAIAISEDVLEE